MQAYPLRDEEDRKRRDVRRMKCLASGVLVAMLALLAVSTAFRSSHPWLDWVHAFAEASAVGAIADWFAVTALFRHPLGLPIPHTAIIPRNKDDIGMGLGEFVEHNFLTADNVIRKLERRNLALDAADFLADPANATEIARRVCVLVPTLMTKLEDEDVRRLLDRALSAEFERLDLAGIASEVLDTLVAHGRHQALLDQGLKALDAWLNRNRALIRAKFSEASRYTPGVIDAFIVRRFVDGILTLLHEVADNPEHDIRSRFDQATRDFIDKLKHSPDYRERCTVVTRELVEHVRRTDYYRRLWDDLKARIIEDIAGPDSILLQRVSGVLRTTANALRGEEALQRKLNGWMLQALEALMMRHRHQIALLIAEVVKSWNASELSEKLELEIGKDLQYIRLNGAFIGGLVGLLIHGATLLGS